MLDETKSKYTVKEGRLEITGYDNKCFIVKSLAGHTLKIEDTFAEMYRNNEMRSSL